jgi:signal recognition particle receptor subunit beta
MNRLLLLEADKKQGAILVSLFRESEAEAYVVNDISDAENLLSSTELSLLLLNYQSIVNAERNELINLFKKAQDTKLVIYNVPDDATRRIAFYRLGAYRIISNKYELEDVYYFSRNLLSNHLPVPGQKESHFSGRLQDFDLAGLINGFGRDKRSGVLRLQSEVSSGKIYFNDGHIYHASVGNLKDDEAVIYLLTWRHGQFSMSPLPQKNTHNRVQLSNVGLLLRAESVREEYFKALEDLGGADLEVSVRNEGDLLEKEKDPLFGKFIQKLSVFRPVYSIVENSPYPVLKTLDQLLTLKKDKNLQIRKKEKETEKFTVEGIRKSSGLSERLFSVEEVQKIREQLGAGELPGGKLLVLGSHTSGKTEFIRQFNHGSSSAVRSEQELDFTTIELSDNFHLQVFGIALTQQLSRIIDRLSENLLGYIFLIDVAQEKELEYINYIISNLTTVHKVPWTLALTNFKKQGRKIPAGFKTGLKLPKEKKILLCDLNEKEDIRTVVLSLKSEG